MSVRFAVSNIALTAFDHGAQLDSLPGLGIEGLEVAPSRVWRDTWRGLDRNQVARYRRRVEGAGLAVVGLHSLFFDHPKLGLFKDAAARAESLEFLTHLSGVCRDLGGRTLIYGSAPARRRGDLPLEDAYAEAIDFLFALTARTDGHGTCFCFEPLGPDETDFINSARDALRVVEAVGSPSLKMQLDAKALLANDEIDEATFQAAAPHLVHFHANDPGLAVLGSTGALDHAEVGRLLKAVGYEGFVSIEQRLFNEDDPLADVARSAQVLERCYR